MIALHGDLKILVATQPVDFRKGVNGLAALVAETLKADPRLRPPLRVPFEAE